MDKCCSYYEVDRHFADCALEPYRYCEDQWIWITNCHNWVHYNCCVDIAKRVVAAVLLVIPTLVAFLISLVAVGLKACYAMDHFTAREAVIFERTQLQGPDSQGRIEDATAKECELRSGIIHGWTQSGKRFYWAPGMERYQECPRNFLLPEHGSSVVSLGEVMHLEVTADQVRKKISDNNIEPCCINYAPVLGIIVLHISGRADFFYSTPDMTGFAPIPKRGVAPATGGFIDSNGGLTGEVFIKLKNGN